MATNQCTFARYGCQRPVVTQLTIAHRYESGDPLYHFEPICAVHLKIVRDPDDASAERNAALREG